MKDVIVVTGTSSGFGALAARALARAGHTVYASMRETTGRNAPQVAEARQYAAEHAVDLRTIELDVASEASADAAIEEIVTAHGRHRGGSGDHSADSRPLGALARAGASWTRSSPRPVPQRFRPAAHRRALIHLTRAGLGQGSWRQDDRR